MATIKQSAAAGDAGLATRPSLTLKRRSTRRPEKVYAAWTDPEKIARWFGPAQVKAGSVQADIDLRVGGRYRISFKTATASIYQVDGVYREVMPNERIAFSWAWHSTPERESQVTVSLQARRRRHAADACTMNSSSTKPRATAMSAAGRNCSTSWKRISPERRRRSCNRTQIVSREEWIAARKAHLAHEKEYTRARERLSEERRALPWVRVDKNYVFDGPGGKQTLADLFEGRSQLVVQHFMFAPDWTEGCKSCSFWADGFERMIPHLAARDTTLVAISRAPLPKLAAFKARMGWTFDWLSSADNDFNYDYARFVHAGPDRVGRQDL